MSASETRAADRSAWRRWLKKNHATASEVWLVYYKKHTGKPSVTYLDSVREALCFGWIDGIVRRIDDETYTHRFTPRRPGSRWSSTNVRLAKELIASGDMTDAGLAAYRRRVEPGKPPIDESSLAPEIETALRADAAAWRNFQDLAPSHRRQYVGWLMSAKRPETRAKRLAEALRLLAENKTLGMK